MKVNVLGCWGGYPSRGGATSGYLITTNEGQVLVDCGSGVMSEMSLITKTEHLESIFLSHLHHDHTADIGIMQYAAVGALRTKKMQDKLKIYAPTEPNELWVPLQSDVSEFTSIEENLTISAAGMEVTFKPVSHTIPCYAMRFVYKDKVFAYSADSSYDDALIELAANADLFICEATNCPGSVHSVGTGHMDAYEAGKIARKANVKELVLTHLPHDGDFKLMKKQAEQSFGNPVLTALDQAVFIL